MAKLDASLVLDFMDANAHSKSKVNFSIWDLGGQRVFYALHHVFLSRYGVYLTVFDMRKLSQSATADTRDEALAFLRHWLHSISLHAPAAPVFLLGTHKDTIKTLAEHRSIDALLRDAGLAKFPALRPNEEDRLCFWPVDNTLSASPVGKGDAVVERLRADIERAVANEEYIRREIPLAWTRLFDLLISSKARHMTLDSVVDLARSKCGFTDQRQVTGALAMFHELGLLLHFRDSPDLNRIVVLDPQWLIDTLSLVIRDFSLHHYPEDVQAELQYRFHDDYKSMRVEGITSRELLMYLWREEDAGSETDFSRRHVLVALMKNMMLACVWRGEGEQDEDESSTYAMDHSGGRFLVPSLLRLQHQVDPDEAQRRLDLIERQVPAPADATQATKRDVFCFDFATKSFLPAGLFERLVSIIVQHAQSPAFKRSRRPLLASRDVLLSSFGNIVSASPSSRESNASAWFPSVGGRAACCWRRPAA